MNDGVIGLIERELSGVRNLLYFESSADTSGSAQISVTFKPGTDPELAQVDVQNRLKAIEARLPQAVRQNGVTVESAASGFLLMVSLTSGDGLYDEVTLSNYMARNIVEELRRIDGVGRVQLFGSEQAMRIWVDPFKLNAYNLSMSDISAAITQQNVQISPGRLGDMPALSGQQISVPLTVQGQLTSPEQFSAIVLKARGNGAKVLLSDVARIELGAQSYGFSNREDGKPAAVAAVQLAPGANAVRTAEAIQARMAELRPVLPSGVSYSLPYNTAPFVKISIQKVVQTLIEAMVLVFIVMYLFLQNMRYTLIPAIVAPIALMGTLAVMFVAGFSVNVLTMFGMVLAIGIIVDDAIVVVENVERIMASEGLGPRRGNHQGHEGDHGCHHRYHSGADGGIHSHGAGRRIGGRNLQAVRLVDGCFHFVLGLPGAELDAGFMCHVTEADQARPSSETWIFGWFNRRFASLTQRYESRLIGLVARSGRMMLIFLAISGILIFALRSLPSAFLPEEDQGYFMTSFQLPSDAAAERTSKIVKQFERYLETRTDIKSNMSVLGFGFSGSGPNAAMAFTELKDWNQRKGSNAMEEVMHAQAAMENSSEGLIMSLMPPAIDELGNSSGFTLRLQDRANQGYAALKAAEAKLLELAARSKLLKGVYPEGLPSGASVRLGIDRHKAAALGVFLQ